MPNTLQDGLTLGDIGDIDLEEAEGITLGEAQGDALGNINGFTYKRSTEIDRSGFVTTSAAVSRT